MTAEKSVDFLKVPDIQQKNSYFLESLNQVCTFAVIYFRTGEDSEELVSSSHDVGGGASDQPNFFVSEN